MSIEEEKARSAELLDAVSTIQSGMGDDGSDAEDWEGSTDQWTDNDNLTVDMIIGSINMARCYINAEKARSAKLIEALKDLNLCADAENWISDTLIHDICTQAINEYAKGEAE